MIHIFSKRKFEKHTFLPFGLSQKEPSNATSITFFHKNFTTNPMWQVVTGSNLELILKLLFFPSITTSKNLSLKICCKNVVDVKFLKRAKELHIN